MDHKTRDILFVLVLILAMVGLLVWYLLARPSASLPVGTIATSTVTGAVSVTSQPAAPASHLKETGQYYDADLEYPSDTPLAQSAGAEANAAAIASIKTYDENTLATFEKDSDVADITPQVAADEGLGGENKYELTSKYKLYTSPATVSYAFTVVEDTLGAHPNSYFKTFTFDAKSGTSLALSDIFVSGTPYLNTLSALTRAALIEQLGSSSNASFIDPGTTPDATNFQSFVFDGSDLVIFFAPYQVGPYSSGPQIVRIPLSKLKDILKPAYQ
jgi:hypothetical protein